MSPVILFYISFVKNGILSFQKMIWNNMAILVKKMLSQKTTDYINIPLGPNI